jgi:alpha-D-xyloside xylohydrolase
MIEVDAGSETIRLDAWGRDGVRIRIAPGPITDPVVSGLGDQLRSERVDEMSVRNGCTVVELRLWRRSDHDAEHLLWSARNVDDAEPWLSEVPAHWNLPARSWTPTQHDGSWSVATQFAARRDERWYGLGQHQHGLLDQRGAVVELVQRNTEVAVPVLVSDRGHALVWNHAGTGRVELGTSATRLVADATAQLDLWVTCPGSVPVAIERMTAVTGRAPAPPPWFTGFWQSRLRYSSQEEVLAVAHEHRRRGLPLSVIVIDFFHWTRFGEHRFDPERFPDPAAMVSELRSIGVEPFVSVWPTVHPGSEAWHELEANGWLVEPPGQLRFVDVPDFEPVSLTYYDAFAPDARASVAARIVDGYVANGIRGLWVDACEPEMYPERHDELTTCAGPLSAVGSAYPAVHAGGLADALRGAGVDAPVLLCRSSWIGGAAHGSLVWSGDVPSTWDALARHVPAGLNMGLSGFPWWTHDIGGFKGARTDDPEFHELLVRWFELGVFTPVCRLHGMRDPSSWSGGAPNEVWSFGEDVERLLTALLALRESLRPTIDALLVEASQTGAPVIRPVWWAHPDDSVAWNVEDQWCLGDDIVFAPVVEPGVRDRRCYLPGIDAWTHVASGARFDGGQWVKVPALLGSPTWFSRYESR